MTKAKKTTARPSVRKSAKRAMKPAAKKPAPKKVEIRVLVLPPLNKGELYAGPVIEKGQLKHHVILLPGDVSMTWADALAWAKKQGGELPTRKEQALLFANAAEAFEQRWYWSNEVHPGYADSAFVQYFGNGTQGGGHKGSEYRARAVRRVSI